jgi:glycosyltransferase involved in cell wall biosynthesis
VSADAAVLGDLTISMLQGESGVLKKEFDKLLEWTRHEPRPDVVNLPNSLLIALAAPLKRALGSPVFVTLQGEELFLDGLTPQYRERALALIRGQVSQVDGFIAVSEYCARFMSALLHIPSSRIAVVPLGIDMTGYERHEAGAPFRVGYFARIAPEKGLHELADAYIRFRRRTAQSDVRFEAAGYLGATHEGYLRDVRRLLEGAGLGGEFEYHGAVDRSGKLAFLRSLDVLSVPATYDEPKGMFLLEAMASGVPVVQPRRGAFTEVVQTTGGGILVEPDDIEALADGLFKLWSDRTLAAQLGQRAFDGVRSHYTITHSAGRLLAAYAGAQSGASMASR